MTFTPQQAVHAAALDRNAALEERVATLTRERDEARAALTGARDEALEEAAQVLDASARIAGKEADDTWLYSVDARILRDRAVILESHAAAIRDMKGKPTP